MKFFVGITDSDWFNQLASERPDEVNFWKPGEKGGFAALEAGGLFLFKLHSPHNFIVGGGHYVRFTRLPISLTWEAFGRKNGVTDLVQFRRRIAKYRAGEIGPDPEVGCIVLNQPFFFERNAWIDVPKNWPMNTVIGKNYLTTEREGAHLYSAVKERLGGRTQPQLLHIEEEERARFGKPYLEQARLGQGAFRVLVTDAYQRRCAITGERTLPVLQAFHIKPFAEEGPNHVDNGLLLRADLHILFDQGLITVTPEHKVLVSDQIRERFENGRDYYALRDQPLRVLPGSARELPSEEHLVWHNEQRFVA